MPRTSTYYQIEGSLPADRPSYVTREADEQLFQSVRDGRFCYVLTTRQMGKSSLMLRTAERLTTEAIEDVRVATVDLTGIAKDSVTADQWYYTMAHDIMEELGLSTDLGAWWDRLGRFPPHKRWIHFLRDTALGETSGPVVIFVDEIENTLGLSFAPEFFAGIRWCYNARAKDARFRRLTFVLLGVAQPSDLIADPRRTPFNIGTSIELTDFRRDQAGPLAEGLPQSAERDKLLDEVLSWTGGHPYLTQKVCLLAAEQLRQGFSADIAGIVQTEFFTPGAEHGDSNLHFVRNQVANRGVKTTRLLRLYARVWRGKPPVKHEPASAMQNELKLAGLVKPNPDGTLKVRNRIYEKVFNESWIKDVRPPTNYWRRVALVLGLLLLLSPGFWYEVIYPRQFTRTLEIAGGEREEPAKDAHDRLRRFPLFNQRAEVLWRIWKFRRASWLDDHADRSREAYRLADLARRELSQFPAFQKTSDEQFCQFFERRAVRAAYSEHRDEAILWSLKALTVLASRDEIRRTANNLISSDYARLVKTIRLGSSSYGTQSPLSHPWAPSAVIISLDGHHVAGGGPKGIRVWDLERPCAPPIDVLTAEPVYSISSSRDGRFLAGLGQGPGIRVWDLKRPTDPPIELGVDRGTVFAVAFGNDGRLAAAGSRNGDGVVLVWDLAPPTKKPIKLRVDEHIIFNLEFSRDGHHLAGGERSGETDDPVVWLWDLRRPEDPPTQTPRRSSSGRLWK
jgi:AAA-like domain/WD domain, G-beta repeat